MPAAWVQALEWRSHMKPLHAIPPKRKNCPGNKFVLETSMISSHTLPAMILKNTPLVLPAPFSSSVKDDTELSDF